MKPTSSPTIKLLWAAPRLLSFTILALAHPVHAVEFQVPQRYAVPATYSVAGSTVKGEQSNPGIGYWDGSKVIWGSVLQLETVCLSDVGYVIQCFKGLPSRTKTIYKPLTVSKSYATAEDAAQPFRISGSSGPQGTIRGSMLGLGPRVRLHVPGLSPQGIGLSFVQNVQKVGDSGSWRQQFNAQSTIRINKPGAAFGEKIQVRVVGEITGQSSGKDLQHTSLEARIRIDQVADLRIAGPNPNPNPRVTINKYVDVPVNTDLRWQVAFNIYASGQQGTTDCAVVLTKQEITLELPVVPGGSFTSVPPPVKPLTGSTVGIPNQQGAVVVPGQPSGGTTITRPVPEMSVGTPAPGGTSITPGMQRAPLGSSSTSTSPPRPPGALVIPRGVEAEDKPAGQ